MKEITSKRNKYTQFVTEEEWGWLKAQGIARNFYVKEAVPITLPNLSKTILKPKIKVEKSIIKKPIIKPEVKNKKK